MPRARVVAALVAVLLIVTGAVTYVVVKRSHQPAARSGPEYGIAQGSSLFGFTDDQLDELLSRMHDLGTTRLRVDIQWSAVEATRGQLNFSEVDRVVDRVRKAGIDMLGIVAYTPVWARPSGSTSDHVPPTDPAEFGRFAGAVAEHFHGRITAYEVWNEASLDSFFLPKADAARYTGLLKAAYPAIKKAAPDASVLVAGLPYNVDSVAGISATAFLDQVYASGGGGMFDAVGTHPYTYPLLPITAVSSKYDAVARLQDVWAVMDRHGDGGKKIWVTEYGAPTGSGAGAVSEPDQAAAVSQAIRMIQQYRFVDSVFLYSLYDAGTKAADPEENFGLITTSGRMKPAYGAAKSAIAARP